MAKAADNVHDRHPSADEEFDTAEPGSADPTTIQEVRDRHFLEDGVDAKGRTKKHFDADGNEVEE